ncbi:hypothetical protein JCM8097_008834 [Rhodosporidiobolus ruineniae]
MTVHSPQHVELSARLVRIAAPLAVQLDPMRAIPAGAMQHGALELGRMLENSGGSIPDAVALFLHVAFDSLTPPDSAVIPYAACLDAHVALGRALQLLAASDLPSAAFSRLPMEILARVVDFCQTDDFRLRQSTNVALAQTCRSLHGVVSPILAAERHVCTAGQLERLYRLVSSNRETAAHVRQLTITVGIEELERQQDGRWAGRFFESLLWTLKATLRSLRIRIEPGQGWDFMDFQRALGMSPEPGDDWQHLIDSVFRGIEDVEHPIFDNHGYATDIINTILKSPATVHARIGHASLPYPTWAEFTRQHLVRQRRLGSDEQAPKGSFRHLRTLSAPYFAFYPLDLFTLLRPLDPATPPILQHLDIALRLTDPGVTGASNLEALDTLFSLLAPSLRRLAVRISAAEREGHTSSPIQSALAPAIRHCIHLEQLEVGGRGLDEGVLSADGTALPFPRLEHLTVLPLLGMLDLDALERVVDKLLPPSLRRLVLCIPANVPRPSESVWPEKCFRYFEEDCERQGIKLKIETRVEEDKWFRHN